MEKWHGGSRFWRIAPLVILLSAVLAMYFDDPNTFTAVAVVIMGGASAKSWQDERNKGFDEDER